MHGLILGTHLRYGFDPLRLALDWNGRVSSLDAKHLLCRLCSRIGLGHATTLAMSRSRSFTRSAAIAGVTSLPVRAEIVLVAASLIPQATMWS